MIKKFVIDRSKWYPSEVHDDILYIGGSLYNNGRMCCLGVFLKANGYTDTQMNGLFMPEDFLKQDECDRELFDLLITESEAGPFTSSLFANAAADINDKPNLNTQERERKIIELFASKGIEVTFVGDLNLDEVRNNLVGYGVEFENDENE
jgi:hypothetical protein